MAPLLSFAIQIPEQDLMLDQLITFRSFDVVPHITALVIAYALAFPIGWNREKEERSAGLRTFPLVAIASCGFVQAAETILHGEPKRRPGSSRG